MSDSKGTSCAVTKLIVKKPTTEITIANKATGLDLKVGEGKRLIVNGTKDNTDSKEMAFSIKGKGVKVSKSGYVTAVTPGSSAVVTVKSGKLSDSIQVRVSDDYKDKYLALSKTSVNVTLPKPGAKPKTVAIKLTLPKKAEQPTVTWSVARAPQGITIDQVGKICVDSTASPGCYTVKATAEGFNTACCELIIK